MRALLYAVRYGVWEGVLTPSRWAGLVRYVGVTCRVYVRRAELNPLSRRTPPEVQTATGPNRDDERRRHSTRGGN